AHLEQFLPLSRRAPFEIIEASGRICRWNPPQQRIAGIGLRVHAIADQRNDLLHLRHLNQGRTRNLSGRFLIPTPARTLDPASDKLQSVSRDVASRLDVSPTCRLGRTASSGNSTCCSPVPQRVRPAWLRDGRTLA